MVLCHYPRCCFSGVVDAKLVYEQMISESDIFYKQKKKQIHQTLCRKNIIISRSVSALFLSHCCCCVSVRDLSNEKMACRLFWASRVASHLRISVAQRGFSSGESQSPFSLFDLLC